APTLRFIVPSALDTTTISATLPLALSWTGGDSLSRLRNFQVQQSVNGGLPYTNLTLASPLTTSTQRTLTIGSRYQFQARAIDLATNVSAYATARQISLAGYQDYSGALSYSSTPGWTS